MATTKFSQFLESNRPAPVVVPWADVKAAVAHLELKLERERFLGGEYRVTDGSENYVGFSGVDVILKYEPARGGDFVVYKPRITNSGSSCYVGGSDAHVSEILRGELSARFAPEVTVPLPEGVVALPVPGWVKFGTDDPYTSVYGSSMFESEARTALDAFAAEANAVVTGTPKMEWPHRELRDVVAEWLAAYDEAAAEPPETEVGTNLRLRLQDVECELHARLEERRHTIAYNMV